MSSSCMYLLLTTHQKCLPIVPEMVWMEYDGVFLYRKFLYCKKNIQKYALLNTQPPQYLADILTKIIEMEVS